MRPIGFSTGAVAFGDFRAALELLRGIHLDCVELSALRLNEVSALLSALRHLDLQHYSYVSVHAPSSFTADDEATLVQTLIEAVPSAWPIVLHPDTVHDVTLWSAFGSRLAIENMDRRKKSGRTLQELKRVFDLLPDARLCFDAGHARQCDNTMTEAFRILETLGPRICQVHISEVNSSSQHDSISFGAKLAFQRIAGMIPESTPVIIESRVANDKIRAEVQQVIEALTPVGSAAPAQA